MPRKIVAIQVNTSPTRWVESTFKKPNYELGVLLTEEKNVAKDYGTKELATDAIKKFANPFERKFTPMKIEVTQPVRIDAYLEDLM